MANNPATNNPATNREINIPDFCTVILAGASGSGKSTFARKYFMPTEIISSDVCRALVSDDPVNQQVSHDAFELVHATLRLRLKNRRLAVVDATNLEAEYRQELTSIARSYHCPVVAIAFDSTMEQCLQNNEERQDRKTEERVIRRQLQRSRKLARKLRNDGIGRVYAIHGNESANDTVIRRWPLGNDRRSMKGPFDLIGDIHGCSSELNCLLALMGYQQDNGHFSHPQGRTAIFLGDLVDRGPGVDMVLDTVMQMQEDRVALCVEGNHENKLERALRGKKVQMTHGITATMEQLEPRGEEYKQKVRTFLEGLQDHLWLDEGRLVAAHAGIREEYIGRASKQIRDFCLYGETTGETDEYGLVVRYPWAQDYRGNTTVVYGHTPVETPAWLNNTICLDTGAVFGGSLTALRWPERELVSVPALREHYPSVKPIARQQGEKEDSGPDNGPDNGPDTQGTDVRNETKLEKDNSVLDIRLVLGQQEISTRLQGTIRVSAAQNEQALETMARFSINPKLLIYLPPTVSPGPSCTEGNLLERPEEVLDQYVRDGISRVVAEEKHMGSRALILVGKSSQAIEARFGADYGAGGVVYSRTGRRFFNDAALEAEILERIRRNIESARIWEELDTEWILLDAEIMPWSLKAQGLIRRHYAPVGAAGQNTLDQAMNLLHQAEAKGLEVGDMIAKCQQRLENIQSYRQAYQHYFWPTENADDISIAPFHLLTGQQGPLTGQNNAWHMEMVSRMAAHQPAEKRILTATQWTEGDPADEDDRQRIRQLWDDVIEKGGEGLVIKSLEFEPRGNSHMAQPAIKVRGPQYLRIIYGPDYDMPGNIERLRRRRLRGKQNMAVREFALGLEGLERFHQGAGMARVNQCVQAVLAMESEPSDPRL